MKRVYLLANLLLFFLYLISCKSSAQLSRNQEVKSSVVVIKGKVLDEVYEYEGKTYTEKNEWLYVIDKYDMYNVIAFFPVVDNQVNAEFEFKEFKQFLLSSDLGQTDGAMVFYPDSDTIHFTINPNERNRSELIGGELTKAYHTRRIKESEFLSKKRKEIVNQYGEFSISSKYTDKGLEWIYVNEYANKKWDSVRAALKHSYYKELPDVFDLVNFDRLIDDYTIPSSVDKLNIDNIITLTKEYQKELKNETYDSISNLYLANLKSYHKEKGEVKFSDFSTKDGLGNSFRLSDSVGRNDYLLLDIWATWCGACIGKSKETIPIYEKHSANGFDVFSVMTDARNVDFYSSLVAKYNFPWEVYHSINNESEFKSLYGIMNSGGGRFLINRQGVIVLSNPTKEELEEFLNKSL